MNWRTVMWTVAGILACGGLLAGMLGAGGYKRWTTISGVYSVCRPQNYDVVCFLDASSKDGGLSCVPLAAAGGVCNPRR